MVRQYFRIQYNISLQAFLAFKIFYTYHLISTVFKCCTVLVTFPKMLLQIQFFVGLILYIERLRKWEAFVIRVNVMAVYAGMFKN